VGLAGVILAILGLAGTSPFYMLTISTIAVGAALAFEGGAISARHVRALSAAGVSQTHATEMGGVTAEFVGGVAAVILGILALLSVVPYILTPIAAIVLGGSLLIGSGTTSHLAAFAGRGTAFQDTAVHDFTHEALYSSAGAKVLCGIAGGVLGILALIGVNTLELTLVAMLILGAAIVLGSASLGGRLTNLWQR